MMPRSSRACRQASRARATSSGIASLSSAPTSVALLRTAVTSSPITAKSRAAAVSAPKSQPAVSMVWAKAGSGSIIFRM